MTPYTGHIMDSCCAFICRDMIKKGNVSLLVNTSSRKTIQEWEWNADAFGGQLEKTLSLSSVAQSLEVIDLLRYRHLTVKREVCIFLRQHADRKPFGFLFHLS